MDSLKRIKDGPFKPTWESLRGHACPDWFRDAKLGLWSHWGPQCVPMYGGNYANKMYMEGRPEALYHRRTYGHQSEFGFKDIIPLWKAERFDPDALMDLYVRAGARYFCTIATHHDNYDLWESGRRWSSPRIGPMKDIVGMYQSAARNHGLPFGVTEHLALSYNWFSLSKDADSEGPYRGMPYDGIDPDYEDLYHPTKGQLAYAKEHGCFATPTDPTWFPQWFDRMKALIDRYKPDLLYSDSHLPFDEYGLGIVAHLYNTSIAEHGGINHALYTQKDTNPLVYQTGILDLERSVLTDTLIDPWQTDTSANGWFYDVRGRYKTARQIIEMLVDVVAKNGNLLINFPQLPDGTLDAECLAIMAEMGEWIAINGEGIYGTRPWYMAMEGEVRVEQKRIHEPEMAYTPSDYRFTSKGGTIYAFQLGWPTDGRAVITSFAASSSLSGKGQLARIINVEDVSLLGYDGPIQFQQTREGLVLTGLPTTPPVDYAHCFRIQTRG